MAMVDRLSISFVHSDTFWVTYSSTNVLVPSAAPRCRFPLVVIAMPESWKMSDQLSLGVFKLSTCHAP